MLCSEAMGTNGEAFVQPHRHAVQFYASDSSLVSTVAGFISEGLVAGQPAMVVATTVHRAAFTEELAARGVDVDHARRRGDLVMIDARETLDLFMIDGKPSPALFSTYVGSILDQMLRGRGRTIVRAYGEMVDLLWKDGKTEAAIELEILWNKLAQKHGFALLCAYSMGNFYKKTDQYQEVCRQHSHVIDVGAPALGFV
jgi:KaiC/GvpD/RAD55 family RecA-like ATPase